MIFWIRERRAARTGSLAFQGSRASRPKLATSAGQAAIAANRPSWSIIRCPAVRCRRAGQGVGDRHHLYPDHGGLCLSGRRDRPVFTARHRLVAAEPPDDRRRIAGAADGGLATEAQAKVLIHSDQGSQFTSMDWAAFLKHRNLEHSISRRGNCHDNAVAESFFNLLKREADTSKNLQKPG